ncbi:MAG: TonB family protein, partial [Novosphingobium sp.]
MAYASISNRKNRTATLIAVSLLEAGVVYALITGLSFTYLPQVVGPQVEATNIPEPHPTVVPDPPQTKTHAETKARVHDPMPMPVPFDPIDPRPTASSDPFDGPVAGPTTEPWIKPAPSGVPARPARARGDRTAWVTPDAYPSRDLWEGNEGAVSYLLAISASGAVTNCTVTRSSGFPGLDAATCRELSRRARFDAASDETGAKVVSNYAGTVRWTIPH